MGSELGTVVLTEAPGGSVTPCFLRHSPSDSSLGVVLGPDVPVFVEELVLVAEA